MEVGESLSAFSLLNAFAVRERTRVGLDPFGSTEGNRNAGFQILSRLADNGQRTIDIEIGSGNRTSGDIGDRLSDSLNRLFTAFYNTNSEDQSSALNNALASLDNLVRRAVQDTGVTRFQLRLGTVETQLVNPLAPANTIGAFTGLAVEGNLVRDRFARANETVLIDLAGQRINLSNEEIFEGFPTGNYRRIVENTALSANEVTQAFELSEFSAQILRDAVTLQQRFNAGDATDLLEELNSLAGRQIFSIVA